MCSSDFACSSPNWARHVSTTVASTPALRMTRPVRGFVIVAAQNQGAIRVDGYGADELGNNRLGGRSTPARRVLQ